MTYSLRFTGASTSIDVKVKPFPTPSIKRNVTWAQTYGRWIPADRGADGDAYEAEIVVFGNEATMQAFFAWMDTEGRGVFSVSSTDGVIFAPNMNQEVANDVIVVNRDRQNRVFWASSTNGINEVKLTLRAVAPSLYSTTGSLSTLRIQPQYEADHSYGVNPVFSESGGVTVFDRRDDAGEWTANFEQKPEEMKAILNFLVGSGRADTFTLPNLIPYPFGVSRGSGPFSARAVEFSIGRKDLNYWTLKIKFAEERL